ncbi:hypothetical protein KCU69_g21507, partial [Aureobasidium melanogenum]
GFSDSEDAAIIQRARAKQLKKKGIDPKATKATKKPKDKEVTSEEPNAEDQIEEKAVKSPSGTKSPKVAEKPVKNGVSEVGGHAVGTSTEVQSKKERRSLNKAGKKAKASPKAK